MLSREVHPEQDYADDLSHHLLAPLDALYEHSLEPEVCWRELQHRPWALATVNPYVVHQVAVSIGQLFQEQCST